MRVCNAINVYTVRTLNGQQELKKIKFPYLKCWARHTADTRPHIPRRSTLLAKTPTCTGGKVETLVKIMALHLYSQQEGRRGCDDPAPPSPVWGGRTAQKSVKVLCSLGNLKLLYLKNERRQHPVPSPPSPPPRRYNSQKHARSMRQTSSRDLRLPTVRFLKCSQFEGKNRSHGRKKKEKSSARRVENPETELPLRSSPPSGVP